MNEPKSGSTARKPLTALHFSDLRKGEEGPWERIVLELLAVRILQDREDIEFDEAIDRLDDELGEAYYLTGRAVVDGELALRVGFACMLARDAGRAS